MLSSHFVSESDLILKYLQRITPLLFANEGACSVTTHMPCDILRDLISDLDSDCLGKCPGYHARCYKVESYRKCNKSSSSDEKLVSAHVCF